MRRGSPAPSPAALQPASKHGSVPRRRSKQKSDPAPRARRCTRPSKNVFFRVGTDQTEGDAPGGESQQRAVAEPADLRTTCRDQDAGQLGGNTAAAGDSSGCSSVCSMPNIYWEKQDREFCQVHAVNAMLQSRVFECEETFDFLNSVPEDVRRASAVLVQPTCYNSRGNFADATLDFLLQNFLQVRQSTTWDRVMLVTVPGSRFPRTSISCAFQIQHPRAGRRRFAAAAAPRPAQPRFHS